MSKISTGTIATAFSDWHQSARRFSFCAPSFDDHIFEVERDQELLFQYATAWIYADPGCRLDRLSASVYVSYKPAWTASVPALSVEHTDTTRKLQVPVHAPDASLVRVARGAYGQDDDIIVDSVRRQIAFEGLREVVLVFQVLSKRPII